VGLYVTRLQVRGYVFRLN